MIQVRKFNIDKYYLHYNKIKKLEISSLCKLNKFNYHSLGLSVIVVII